MYEKQKVNEGEKQMKKRILAMAAVLSLGMSFTSFAAQWQQNDTGWWWQNDDGSYPVSTWKEINSKWYYFDAVGYMAANRWEGDYYLDADGAMLTDTMTPDGFYVDENGEWDMFYGFIFPEEDPDELYGKYSGYDYSWKQNNSSKYDSPKVDEPEVETEPETEPETDNNDKMQEANEKLKKSYEKEISKLKRELEKAQAKLSKAESNKTIRVYKEDIGFVYVADEDAIRDAQYEVDYIQEQIEYYEDLLASVS